MRIPILLPVALAALLASAPAVAAPFDKVFFVKRGGSATAMYEDRDACAKIAEGVGFGRGGEAYSDPDYGVLSAMGAALDADSMNGGVAKAVRRAALEKCMEKRGWTQKDPAEADEKTVRRASRKNPAGLDAWLRANEPAAEPATTVAAATASEPAPPPASGPIAATPPATAAVVPTSAAPATPTQIDPPAWPQVP